MSSISPGNLADALEPIHPAEVPGDSGTLNGISLAAGDDASRRARGTAAAGASDDEPEGRPLRKVAMTCAGLLVAVVAATLVAPSNLYARWPAAPAAPGASAEAPRDDVVTTTTFDLASALDKQPSEPRTKAPAPPAIEATKGELSFPKAANGHRIYVDGKGVGEPPAPIVVACGQHVVKVGSRGRARTMLVPCGESVVVPYP